MSPGQSDRRGGRRVRPWRGRGPASTPGRRRGRRARSTARRGAASVRRHRALPRPMAAGGRRRPVRPGRRSGRRRPSATAGTHAAAVAAGANAPMVIAASEDQSSGIGATRRPCCSSTRQSSVIPSPAPPCASGSAMPRRPAAASADHNSRSNRSADCSTDATRSGAARSARIFAASDETACCSSVNAKSIRSPPGGRRRA